MIKKITLLIFLISTIFGSQNHIPAIQKAENNIIIQKDSEPNYSHITKTSIASFIVGIFVGLYTAYDQLTEPFDPSIKMFADISRAFIHPLAASAQAIAVSAFINLWTFRKLSIVNFILPPYITIPTFYGTWFAAYSLLKK